MSDYNRITLHLCNGGRRLLLVPFCIDSVSEQEAPETGSEVYTRSGRAFYVRESMDEVVAMLEARNLV